MRVDKELLSRSSCTSPRNTALNGSVADAPPLADLFVIAE
jgi:hypothetical protein